MCTCGYGNESAKSTGAHLRYCDGAIPEEHLRQHKCDIYHFSTDDANGLLVHRSVAHKEQYNKELVAKEKGYKWTKPELGYLAEIILELKRTKTRNVNRAAGSRLGRTEQAVQKIRQKAEYRQIERELKEKRGEVVGSIERSHTTEEEPSNMRVREQTTSNTGIIELQEGIHHRNSETPSSVYKRKPSDGATPSLNTIRRQLPAVPPTPFNEDQRISQLLLNENSSLTIVNTPSVQPSPRERRILPETPLDRSRQRCSSLPLITTITQKTPITNPRAHITNLPTNHGVGVVETPTSRPVRSRMETIRSLPNRNRSVILDTQGRPDYKKAAYLDCRSYAATLCSENILDKTVKEYLEGNTGWNKVTEVIASEERAKVKKPRTRKGPWMKNRRENRNTQNARIYQFTQKAYDQNKKATINKIINGNFSLNNSDQVYPDIKEVESVYTKRLEEVNKIDLTEVEFPEDTHSDLCGKFTEKEVRECIRDLRRHTAAGPDGITTPDIRNVPIGHSTAIMNSWWGWRIPKESAQCRTSLLPKKEEGLENVSNWRPITVGNLYMRLYAKLLG